jgi:hypothetical protein|tara:strand:+ start:1843 stop:2358 length:516 start_codon:yes stop_codon:yes gene_type:complete
MEARLRKKAGDYVTAFKNDIREKILEMPLSNDSANELLSYIYAYEQIDFSKEDFEKRKRVKNVVPVCERCNARRADNTQCSRKRRDGSVFCGTHIKGTPHGVFSSDDTLGVSQSKQVQVTAQEINGIIYYIDSVENVYKMEDVLSSKTNPRIIAKYVKNMDGTYSIPDFSI